MTNPLSLKEQSRLFVCLENIKKSEDLIEEATQSLWDFSEAYNEIKESKLYRQDGTLKGWCDKNLKHGYRRAQQIVSSAKALKRLEKVQNFALLENEAQISELSKVPAQYREEVIKIASEGGITAKKIQEALQLILDRAVLAEIIELDKTEAKFPIPMEILSDWNKAKEVGKELLKKASELKVTLEKARETHELIFREVSQTSATHAINLYTALKSIIPHSVCTSCQGRNSSKCTTCSGRGFFSKDFYDVAIPKEIKELRIKASK